MSESESIRPIDTCRYIATQAAELHALALGSDLKALAYILDMARMEAISAAEQIVIAEGTLRQTRKHAFARHEETPPEAVAAIR